MLSEKVLKVSESLTPKPPIQSKPDFITARETSTSSIQSEPPNQIGTSAAFSEDELYQAKALKTKEWRRSKIMLVGEGEFC